MSSRKAVIQTGLIQTGLIQTGLIQTGLIQTGLIQTGLIQTGLIQTGLIQTGLLPRKQQQEVYNFIMLRFRASRQVYKCYAQRHWLSNSLWPLQTVPSQQSGLQPCDQ